MKLTYSLGADDFLAFQLHSAGESAHGRRRRMISRILMVVAIALVGLVQHESGRTGLAIAFFCAAAIIAVVYPSISKWIHRRHFRRHVAENYQKRIGSNAVLRLEDEGVVSAGEDGEGILKYTAIDQLAEIETLGLIKLKAGVTLLLPKDQIGEEKLREFMEELARRSGVEVVDKRGRRWR